MEEMNVSQLFFALIKSDETHPTFVKDHQPVWSGIHWFIKDLHQCEGEEVTYDFLEIQRNINEGYSNGSMVMAMVGNITDKYFRDGHH